MTEEEREKLFNLRCKSKMGCDMGIDEFAFISEMYSKYPEEYKAMNKEIFDKTKPFGS